MYGAVTGHQASATNPPGDEQEGGWAEPRAFPGLSAFSKAKAQCHLTVAFSMYYHTQKIGDEGRKWSVMRIPGQCFSQSLQPQGQPAYDQDSWSPVPQPGRS